jgi:hypothetical protein
VGTATPVNVRVDELVGVPVRRAGEVRLLCIPHEKPEDHLRPRRERAEVHDRPKIAVGPDEHRHRRIKVKLAGVPRAAFKNLNRDVAARGKQPVAQIRHGGRGDSESDQRRGDQFNVLHDVSPF